MKKPKINTNNENIVLIHKRQLFVAFELLKLERITKSYEKSDLHLSVNMEMWECGDVRVFGIELPSSPM